MEGRDESGKRERGLKKKTLGPHVEDHRRLELITALLGEMPVEEGRRSFYSSWADRQP